MNTSPFHTLAQVGADGRTLLLPGAHEVQGGPSQEGRPPQEPGQQGCDRYKYFGSPNKIQNQIRLVLLVLTDTKIQYHYGKMANFVFPNQIQDQIGFVLLVRSDTRDNMSQTCRSVSTTGGSPSSSGSMTCRVAGGTPKAGCARDLSREGSWLT